MDILIMSIWRIATFQTPDPFRSISSGSSITEKSNTGVSMHLVTIYGGSKPYAII